MRHALTTAAPRNISRAISNLWASVDGLDSLFYRLRRVIFFNTDAVELCRRFDKENAFIYADPPYVHSTRSSVRYDHDLGDDYHKKIIDFALNCKSKIMISGYANGIYDSSGLYRHSLETVTGAWSGNGTLEEFIWTNYRRKRGLLWD